MKAKKKRSYWPCLLIFHFYSDLTSGTDGHLGDEMEKEGHNYSTYNLSTRSHSDKHTCGSPKANGLGHTASNSIDFLEPPTQHAVLIHVQGQDTHSLGIWLFE